jgi:nitrate reductase gamma subunit
MTLFPAPPTEAANRINVLKEAALFRSLFRGDRLLWSFAWVFHVVLALILIGHLRVFANLDGALTKAGMSEGGIQALSSGVGGSAGIIVLVTALLLLVRRVAMPRVREITCTGDVLALVLIGAVLLTGNMMRFGAGHFDLTITRAYFADLATFAGVGGAAALENNVFLVHMGLALALIMYIPFSKILHFGGIFFTQQLIRKH